MDRSVAKTIARVFAFRLATLLTLVFLVALASFALLHALPGDPAYVLLGPEFTPEAYEVLRKDLGLDKPLPVQFINWLTTVAKGGLGVSYTSHHRVASLLTDGLIVTASLAMMTVIVAAAVFVPLSFIGTEKPRLSINLGAYLIGAGGYATPSFLLGAAFIIIVAVPTGWFPVLPRVDWLGAPLETIRGLFLPGVTLAAYYGGLVMVTARSAVSEAWGRDCVQYAAASGVSRFTRTGYVARLSAPSIIAVCSLSFAQLLSGAVLTETVFGLPGLGRLAVQAVLDRDFPVLLPSVMLSAVFFHIAAFVGDVTLSAIDPRRGIHSVQQV